MIRFCADDHGIPAPMMAILKVGVSVICTCACMRREFDFEHELLHIPREGSLNQLGLLV